MNKIYPLIECQVNHPVLPMLFDPQTPNHPALWAVFMGKHAGQALVDDPQYPKQCLLRTAANLTYASRDISQEFLAQAIESFKNIGDMWLVHQANDPPAPDGYKITPRQEFFDYDPHSQILIHLRDQLQEGYHLQRIQMELLQRCIWRDDMKSYCGSLENFLEHGLGMCLMRGEEIIVETYASAFGPVYAEIGAITHPQYRGKGYAPLAVAQLIAVLEERGTHAYWSCDLDNPASARVARKLGFKVMREYEIYEYEVSKETTIL